MTSPDTDTTDTHADAGRDDPDAPAVPDSVTVGREAGRSATRRTTTGVPLRSVDADTTPDVLDTTHDTALDDLIGDAEDTVLVDAHEAALAELLLDAEAANTRRVYHSAWRQFVSWCLDYDYPVLPTAPRIVGAYIAVRAAELHPDSGEDDDGEISGDAARFRYQAATFGVWVAAIRAYHQASGYGDPTAGPVVRKALAGMRKARTHAGQTPNKAIALRPSIVMSVVDTIAENALDWTEEVAARRDIMVLLVGIASALRRDELTRLQVRDITVEDNEGQRWVRVALRGTKTDQGQVTEICLRPGERGPGSCPCCALLDWMTVLDVHDRAVLTAARRTDSAVEHRNAAIAAVQGFVPGPGEIEDPTTHRCLGAWPALPRRRAPILRALHRSGIPHSMEPMDGGSLARMLKRRCAAAGLDPQRLKFTSPHSLRAGFVTAARAAGATDPEIMRQTRHRRRETVDGYDHTDVWTNNATSKLGL